MPLFSLEIIFDLLCSEKQQYVQQNFFSGKKAFVQLPFNFTNSFKIHRTAC